MVAAVSFLSALAAGQESPDARPVTAQATDSAQVVRRRLRQCNAPVIETQPSNQTIPSGGQATLTVVATGLVPLAYQWYRGVAEDTSAPVGADSPSYTTPALDRTTSFWVRISNACGHASSQTAIVTMSAGSAQEVTVYLGPDDTVPLVLVLIRGGTPFMMGATSDEPGRSASELPQHAVAITYDFYLGKYEVTQAQWEAVMGWLPARFYGSGPQYPVYEVSWVHVAGPTGFIDRLNQAQNSTKFRLPTEAEWEYAARAGTSGEFSFSVPESWDTGCEGFPAAEPSMWWCGNSGRTAHPVGEKLPNPWGLFDMHGNVWEWVQDVWHDDYAGGPPSDGSAWLVPAVPYRVLRGCSWASNASYCRSAHRRSYYAIGTGHGVFGFRLAMTP